MAEYKLVTDEEREKAYRTIERLIPEIVRVRDTFGGMELVFTEGGCLELGWDLDKNYQPYLAVKVTE